MRFWTVDEARAYLPRLREIIHALQRAALATTASRTNGHAPRLAGLSGAAPDPKPGPDEGPPPPLDLRDAAAELAAQSIVVRDLATGLTDFPARGADGVIYLLCYQLEDDDLAYWHLPDEGFVGRKPLPRDPA